MAPEELAGALAGETYPFTRMYDRAYKEQLK
jgi:hypothetical protein